MKRTDEQEAVVQNRGGGLLVSAAAGSGKTRVLVERLLERVITEEKNIHEFLIITFTRAAAEELRGRIAGELSDALKKQPENAHLRRQLTLIYEAQISTIHSFCTVLLRQWGHLMDVPADFTLCEEEEASVLLLRALDEVLEERYQEVDPNFACLLDVLSAGRDDSRLIEIVKDVYAKVQSWPDPNAWLEEQKRAFDLSGVTDVSETPWGKILLEETLGVARYWLTEMEKACDLAQGDPVLEKAYLPSLCVTTENLRRLAESKTWEEALTAEITFPRLGGSRGVEDVEAKKTIAGLRDRCKKAMEKITKSMAGHSDALLADMETVRPAMEGLIDLVKDMSEAYQREKKKKDRLDFSDLEHFAVRLLLDDKGQPTELAKQWGSQYAEIMVDEYQDTNQVQNAIFRAISNEGKNLFFVGDVKQSIYRFRLADPTIFLEKYRTFPLWTQAKEGENRKITLSKNFRSRPEVLESVNDIFRAILSRDLGEMDYTAEEALYPGGSFPEGEGYETEYHLLDLSEFSEKKNKNLEEARFVAGRIRAMLDSGFPVSDGKGGTRPLAPEDIAILLRSPKPVHRFYTQALEERTIGWSAEEGGDLFQTTEISVALSYLQIIDNPRQDIPLIAVLRSPIWGFSGDRLAEIRAHAAEGDYYTALQKAAEDGFSDCKAFLEELELLRFGAGEQSSHRLLWNLYCRTGLLEIMGAMPGGERRRDNLLAFYELARRFEGTGHRGLFSFLLHLNRVRESGSLKTPPSSPSNGGGIRIMSIHRSKGLEFPVVFLCGLGRRFNRMDMQKPVLFHPGLGLGPKGQDLEHGVSFTTLAREAVALKLKKEMMAEEMRLLYVAMTRAKEKLLLVQGLSQGDREIEKAAGFSVPVDPRILSDCNSVGQWILMTAMARPEGAFLQEMTGTTPQPECFHSRWKIRYHRGEIGDEVLEKPIRKTEEPIGQTETEKQEWVYPYAVSSATPAKVTATQIRAMEGEETGVFLLREKEETIAFERPRFAQSSLGLTAAQRGTALHTAMQSVRLDKTGSIEELRTELARLVEQGYLTTEAAETIQPDSMLRFFQSSLGREMRENPSLEREYPFSLLAKANRFYPETDPEETVLLQGVIDCWFAGETGLTIVDFKTDRISSEEILLRGERYRGQLDTYAWALSQLTGQEITRKILWFLRPGLGLDLVSGKILK